MGSEPAQICRPAGFRLPIVAETTSAQQGLTAYDQENFQGKKMEFTSACSNTVERGFDTVRSLKVDCGASSPRLLWEAWSRGVSRRALHCTGSGRREAPTETGDRGAGEVRPQGASREQGAHPRPRPPPSALPSSCLPVAVAQNHKESKMTVFERENFLGRQWEIADDYPSLQAMGWANNEVGSMKVQCGAWVCYQYPGYRGYQYLLESDHHGGDYKHCREWGTHAQTFQVQSIRRVQQ
nr:beta-crystallin A3 [Pelodiscus sinensis]|eukprot:XP_014424042.1 beta-crystallin A3 [Pelodiscus sinensis]